MMELDPAPLVDDDDSTSIQVDQNLTITTTITTIESTPIYTNSMTPPTTTSSSVSATIRENDHAILFINKSKYIFVHCTPNSSARISQRDSRVPLRSLIGCPFGALFELQKGRLVRIEKVKELQFAKDEDVNDEDRDNRNLGMVPNVETQKLTREEIAKMRQDGHSGETIITALVESSTTFKDKTVFSKEKYLKKKLKKYMTIVEVIRPSSFTMCRAYFSKSPKKLGGLRYDSLSQLLSAANIYANQSTICYEECSGVILGSIVERTGGYGPVFSVYDGQQPQVGSARYFNFSEEAKNSIINVNFQNLHQMLYPKTPEVLNQDVSKFSAEKKEEVLAKRALKFQKRVHIAELVQKYCLADGGVNSLVIVAKMEQPIDILTALYPFLASSGSFSIFSQYIQWLIGCYQILRDSESAVNLRLTETWLREYQVLPMRTHPTMNMSGGSGFLLTGTKLRCDLGAGKLAELVAKKNAALPHWKKMKINENVEGEVPGGAGGGQNVSSGNTLNE